MVDISFETKKETDKRLRKVLKQTNLVLYEKPFSFKEFPLDRLPKSAIEQSFALVRDDEVWSCFGEAGSDKKEIFLVWRFHFPEGVDNSGFVGWLASHLKSKFGTGVFVICGNNSKAGGIFDYWGAPYELAQDILPELKQLTA